MRTPMLRSSTLRSSTLTALCLFVTFLIASALATAAPAQGFHFGSGGVHVDIGSPHRYYGNYGNYYGGLNQGCGYGNYSYATNYGGGYGVGYGVGYGGGQAYWHDTTHLDYHPAELVRHRNHYHYQPGQYDVHVDGHWDDCGF
jgi:hypothetical protein